MAADDQEYYGYYYGTEEDRGLLDPAWERQQRKVNYNYRDTVKTAVTAWFIFASLLCQLLLFQGAFLTNLFFWHLVSYADIHSLV